jgi:2-hydroxy-3-oxopropionate reductase
MIYCIIGTTAFLKEKIPMEKPTIGFIGLGIMGKPMASNLIKAGYPLIGHDLDRNAVAEIVYNGGQQAQSPREIAERTQVVITMLPDSPDVEKVALGSDGLIEGTHAGQMFIDMSTIAPTSAVKVADAMKDRGVDCLDAPVSGGEIGAINATLSIMVGGDETIFNLARPIFESLGKTITLCGPNGSGQIVKACNQIQVAINLVGMAEAFVLGAKAGVDPAIILQVLSGGYAQSRVMDARGLRVIRGDYQPGFRSRLHYKDLNVITRTAQEYGVPLPVTSLVRELFSAMLASGRGDLDHSGIITILEDLAQIKVRSKWNE